MNEQIMKKLFSGIHGLVPNPPKMPIIGKESNPKLVKRSKYKKPTYLSEVGRLLWLCNAYYSNSSRLF